MSAATPSSNLTLACTGCSHSQNNTISYAQSDSDPGTQLCATCSVLQRCRTNCIPTKAEWSHIGALVENARSEITRINRETCQNDQTRAEIERKRDGLQRFTDHARSLTAPVRTLPPEVLNEVFEMLCISEYYDALSISEYNPTTTQTLDLSQVCAFWRAAVLSRPALWASLDIDLSEVSTNNMLQLALSYIESSVPRPLRLFITIQHCQPLGVHALDLIERLFVDSHRWHDVRINATDRAVSLLSFKLPVQNCFPKLTNLLWTWGPDESDDDKFENYEDHHLDLLSLSDFPELLTCYINSFSPFHLDSIRMPKLTKLDLHVHFEQHPLAALLQLLPNLRECRIYRLSEEELPECPWIDLPPHYNLRELRLSVLPSTQQFFHSLSLTHLESLYLAGYYSSGSVPFPSIGILPMLNRSQLNLKHLTLSSIDEQKIIQILDCLPLLTTLSLKHIKNLSSTLFKRLTLTSDMANLIPQLNSLDIVDYWRGDGKGTWFLRLEKPTLESLCDMLESRRRSSDSVGVSRLGSLSLGAGLSSSPMSLTSVPRDHRLRERLQTLVDAGLSLNLSA